MGEGWPGDPAKGGGVDAHERARACWSCLWKALEPGEDGVGSGSVQALGGAAGAAVVTGAEDKVTTSPPRTTNSSPPRTTGEVSGGHAGALLIIEQQWTS